MQAQECKFERRPPEMAARLLPCASVTFVGDSVVRLVFNALVAALQSPSHPPPDPVRHADMHFSGPAGLQASFLWRPYATNVTDELRAWRAAGAAPDVVVTGVALWHMLHDGDVAAYRAGLAALQQEWAALADAIVRSQLLHLQLPVHLFQLPVNCSDLRRCSGPLGMAFAASVLLDWLLSIRTARVLLQQRCGNSTGQPKRVLQQRRGISTGWASSVSLSRKATQTRTVREAKPRAEHSANKPLKPRTCVCRRRQGWRRSASGGSPSHTSHPGA